MKHLFAVKSLDRIVGDTEEPSGNCGARSGWCN